MRPLLAILLTLPALAGCLDGGSDDPVANPGAPDPFAAPFLSTITRISETRGGGESSMGVTPDGVLFTNIFSEVYRSDDNGSTWQNLGNPFPLIPNNDPDLAVDADGVVWESRLYALACNAVSVSQDGGATWTNNPVVCNGPVGDRQYVVPTKDCTAYLYWHQVPTFYQTVMKTTDCGVTWLPTGPAETPDGHLLVTDGSSWGGGGFWNPTTGSVFLTYTRSPGLADAVAEAAAETNLADEYPAFSVTRDGMLWEEGVGPAFDGAGLGLSLVMGAADDAGNVYLTWGEAINGTVEIFVAGSRDDGRTWTDKIRVDAADNNHSKVFPAIAAGADGKVAIAYYESEQPGLPDNTHNWTVNLAWTSDIWNGTWSRGNLAGGAIIKDGPICISGTTCTGGREFLDYFALQRMPDGRVATVYNVLTEESGGLRNQFALTTKALLA